MTTEDLAYLPIANCARLLRDGALSPVDLTRHMLERIATYDSRTNSFITLLADPAMEQATIAEAEIREGHYKGPMHGIPVAAKDIFFTAGVRTTGQSRLRDGFIPDEDATAIRRLVAGGAILLGKLATHEFAHGGPSFDLPWPPARNPWNTDHFSGGSSSGSAVAIAAGYIKGALGTDTGGSVRSPASLSGVAGLKPTHGRIGRGGVFPNAFTLDHVGVLTWRARDCAPLLQCLAGIDTADSTAVATPLTDYSALLGHDVRGLRIGVVQHFYEEDLPAPDEVTRTMTAALDVLRELGAVLVPVRLPPLAEFSACKVTIQLAELYAAYEHDLRQHPDRFGADFRRKVLPGVLISAADYVQAQRKRTVLAAKMQEVFQGCRLLVTAGTYGPAPVLRESERPEKFQKPSITHPFNITGHPAMSVCMGFSETGLPLGMQIAGRYFDEVSVIGLADAYETATGWRDRRPVLQRA